MKITRLYAVTFNKQHSETIAVSNDEYDWSTAYAKITVPKIGPMIITEDQISMITEFGGGIKTLEFVGTLWDGDIIRKQVEQQEE